MIRHPARRGPAIKLIVALVAAVALVAVAPVVAQAETDGSSLPRTTGQSATEISTDDGADEGSSIQPETGKSTTDITIHPVCDDASGQTDIVCPRPSPPACFDEISYQTERGDNLAAGGRFTFFGWQGRVHCTGNFTGSISGRTVLLDRSPGRDGQILAAGPWGSASGPSPTVNSNSEARLFDIKDIDDRPTEVEIAIETLSVSQVGNWVGCGPMPSGLRYIRCEGLQTTTSSGMKGY